MQLMVIERIGELLGLFGARHRGIFDHHLRLAARAFFDLLLSGE